MNWDAIGSIGETVGAIATVATLLYLSLQIRSNTLVTKRQSLDGMIDRIIRWQARLTSTPTHLGCWVKGTQDFDSLSVEEKIQFNALIIEVLATLEAALDAARTDDLKPETIAATDDIILQLFRNPGVKEYWQQAIYAEDFMRHVDQISEKSVAIPKGTPGNLPFFVPPDALSQ
jgi:hypothetical protein